MSELHPVAIDIWSDYVCPYCYLELPVLDALKAESALPITVNWHAFELRPYPNPTLDPDGTYLRDVWDRSVHPLANERGLPLKLPPVQPYSKDALAAAEYAKETPHFDAFHDAMFRAFFVEGRDIGSREVIEDVASQVGLDPKAVSDAIDTGGYRDRVDRSLQEGLTLGAQGVPSIFLTDTVTGRKVRLPGAANLATFKAGLAQLSASDQAA